MNIELTGDFDHDDDRDRMEQGRFDMIELADNLQPDLVRDGPKITVVGVGGGGSNAVDSMQDGSLDGVEFIVINTDIQALHRARTPRKIHIGKSITKGLGTGANPVLGEQAANEDRDLLRSELEGADLVFVTAGLGGGTGTGASSVIADVVKELGALSVAITTKPFDFEGTIRRNHAEKGQQILRKKVDTLITVPNQRLITVVDENTTLIEAFKVADSVLKQCVQSISDLITRPGLINLDFADIKAIMDTAGGAVMGVGYGQGPDRADEAFKQASSSPLMEEQVIQGAKGILINITCGPDIKLLEIDKSITKHVREKADGDANIIFGVVISPQMQEEMKVTILATGANQHDKREFAKQRQEERPSLQDRRHTLKTPLPYVEKKGLSETVEGDGEDLGELVFAEKAGASPFSSSASSAKSRFDSGKTNLPQMSKSLFSNLKKERP
ncbi:MAG: cell division protein FtsZ [Candidatus Omnitrophota bacterium]|jgi:cell division protein FtsZ|nr:MAG: cell division protein FtsZ [Candidatus Omnitrophota bacterium]